MIPSGYLDPASLNVVIGYQTLQFPGLVTSRELPNVSVQGRATSLLHIKHAPGVRRQVLFIAGVHAREMMNPDMLLMLCYSLCDAYRSGVGLTFGGQAFTPQQIRSIVQKLDILLIPLVNPDGRQKVVDGDVWWRKNCRDNGAGKGPGVDLNRNQAFLWGERSVGGASDVTWEEDYRGPAASSEPEGRNVAWVLANHPSVWCFVDVHSYSGLILYPWGDAPIQTSDPSKNYANPIHDGRRDPGVYAEYMEPEDLVWHRNTANAMQRAIGNAHGNVYTVQQSFDLYPTTGTFRDLAYAKPFGIRGFTLETGLRLPPSENSFIPSPAIASKTREETMAGLIQLCLLCLPTFEGAWLGSGTVTVGGPPRNAPFRFEFKPLPNGAFDMAEFHNWQGQDLPAVPNNTGSASAVNGRIHLTTEEPSASGWTTENVWSLELEPVDELLTFMVTTTMTPPPGGPWVPVITVQGQLQRAP